MALPKNNIQEYTTTLPRSKKDIKFRPYLVKEDKIMLTANISGDSDEVSQALIQVLTNCTFGAVKIESLDIVDLSWLLVKLREVSKGEIIDITIKCGNTVDGDICGHAIDVHANLKNLTVSDPDYPDKVVIDINDKIKVGLKTIGLDSLNNIFDVSGVDDLFSIVIDSIDYVYDVDSDEMTSYKEFTHDEILEFIESLTNEQYQKIEDYIAKTPKVRLVVPFECPSCGNKEDIVIEELQDFLV